MSTSRRETPTEGFAPVGKGLRWRGVGLATRREASAAGLAKPKPQRRWGTGTANPYARDATSNHGSTIRLLPQGLLRRGGGRQAGDIVVAPTTAVRQPRIPPEGPGERATTEGGAGGAGGAGRAAAAVRARAKKSSAGGGLLLRAAAVVAAARGMVSCSGAVVFAGALAPERDGAEGGLSEGGPRRGRPRGSSECRKGCTDRRKPWKRRKR